MERAWGEVSRAVYAALRRRGANHETAEDIVQDTAFRLLTKGARYDDSDGLARFAHHVAHDLWIDDVRKRSRRVALDATLPTQQHTDEAVLVEDRIVALQAWRQLSERDQLALTATPSENADPQGYVRKHRARRRLVQLLAAMSAVVAFAGTRLRNAAAHKALLATLALAAVSPLALASPPGGSPVGQPSHAVGLADNSARATGPGHAVLPERSSPKSVSERAGVPPLMPSLQIPLVDVPVLAIPDPTGSWPDRSRPNEGLACPAEVERLDPACVDSEALLPAP